ncbi:MAG TPA: hypothetical protein DGK91_14685 [Clostridium sp.]|nr:hypothetical protein [Clostridia bacterium]HCW05645.1 hypothetical protein [Clostridium sp.]
MEKRSHVDPEKLERVPSGKPFEYKDVVEDGFKDENHTEDGKRFKAEVLNGLYSDVKIEKDNGSRLVYKKE